MLRTSTGLRNKILDTGSLRSILNLGFIKIYSGAVPASADDAIDPGNTLLLTLSVAGVGLTFEAAAANGILLKNAAEAWAGVAAASGTASFYRFVTPSDDGTLSTTFPRIQGEIAVAGKDLNMSPVDVVVGTTRQLDYFAIVAPTL